MKIDEAARKAEFQAQQLSVANERAYMERKYHSDGQVCIVPDYLFPVLAIDVAQFRVYRIGDVQLLHLLKTQTRYTDGRQTELIYAAEIKNRPVTVVMKRIYSNTTDDTSNIRDIGASSNEEGGPEMDLTPFKRVK